jgi:hypothetical protein
MAENPIGLPGVVLGRDRHGEIQREEGELQNTHRLARLAHLDRRVIVRSSLKALHRCKAF